MQHAFFVPICSALALLSAYAGGRGRTDATPMADDWAGTYVVIWVKGSPAARDAGRGRAVIDKVPDVEPSTVAPRFRSDLERWRLGGEAGGDASALLRRFDRREYAEMGWATLHANGTIACLSGRSLFICRTRPGAKVTVGARDGHTPESLPTRTGIFGVALHRGGFEMERVQTRPARR